MLGVEILGLVYNWILLPLKEARGYRYHEVSFGGFKMLSLAPSDNRAGRGPPRSIESLEEPGPVDPSLYLFTGLQAGGWLPRFPH